MKKVNVTAAVLLLSSLAPTAFAIDVVERQLFDAKVQEFTAELAKKANTIDVTANLNDKASKEQLSEGLTLASKALTEMGKEVDKKANQEDLENLEERLDDELAYINLDIADTDSRIDSLKEYVDGYIGTVIDDYDGFIGEINTDLDDLEARIDTLDPNKVSEMVGEADSRVADLEDLSDNMLEDIVDLQDAVDNNKAEADSRFADLEEEFAYLEEESDKMLEDIVDLQDDVVDLQDDVVDLQDDVENNELNIAHNTLAIEENEKAIEDTLSVVGALAQGTDARFAQTGDALRALEAKKADKTEILANRASIQQNTQAIAKLDKKLEKGLAAQAALSGLFQPYNVGKFNVTAAVGGYKSKSALAIGSGYRFNEKFAAKAGVAVGLGKGSGVSYNIGVNYEF